MSRYSQNSLYSPAGSRKYLTGDERATLLRLARSEGGTIGPFCWVLLETGCRLSEALALHGRSVDFRQRAIVFESLKKRRSGVFRAIPVSDRLLQALDGHFDLRSAPDPIGDHRRLWTWSRVTAWRRIGVLMEMAGIEGAQACPKGFRHGFGVAAVEAGIPLNLVQRWLGHADMKTTAIYASASGLEERGIASKLWRSHPSSPPTQRSEVLTSCDQCRCATVQHNIVNDAPKIPMMGM